MLYHLPKALVTLEVGAAFQPATPTITGFARLETSPVSPQLDLGLSAPLADPLWLLGRQWQFNELQGEDAGTPVGVDLDVHAAPIDRFAPGAAARLEDAVALDPADPTGVPVEVRVEAEPALATHPRLDGEAGLNLLRRARAAGLPGLLAALRAPAFALPLPLPEDPDSDPQGLRWHLLLAGRAPSAARLATALAPGRGADGRLAALPPALSPPGEEAAALAVLRDWLAWLDVLVVEGPADNPAWKPQRQEYAFSLWASGRRQRVALRADEYTDGRVDWHSFIAEAAGAAGAEGAEPPGDGAPFLQLRRALPVPVRYPGMPADRYWEFEDARVNFAGLEASPSSLVRLVMAEFGLAYGNDWFLLPLELPVGALYQLDGMRVRDSFGVVAPVRASDHALQPPPAAPWRMYELATRGAVPAELGDTLCLADSLSGTLQGPPLEELLLVRDEMANLAWGIERRVQGASGEPLDRQREAERLAWRTRLPDAPDDPLLAYRLATHVPAHWIPLVPKGSAGGDPGRFSVTLQRGGMARFYSIEPALMADAGYADFIRRLSAQDGFVEQGTDENGVRLFVFHPRGRLLKQDPGATGAALALDSLGLAEEEVPRAGAVVTRRFQYARGWDGRAHLWIGRSKTTGSGEAGSGLAFDTVRQRSAFN